jgi:hypothetical protein
MVPVDINEESKRPRFQRDYGPSILLRTGQGTGQIRRKVKEDEIGIGITDAGSLSLKAGEGAGCTQQNINA